MDGLRKTLAAEFSRLYVFNLRGNQRTSGEQSRKEGGKVFGSGSRATVAITLLVKDSSKPSDGTIRYHDIGDYLTREEKLEAVASASSVVALPWRTITPNEHGDWINVRDPAFAKFIPLGDKDSEEGTRIFETYSLGLVTNRDAWAYNFSKERLVKNMGRMIDFYEAQRRKYSKTVKEAGRSDLTVEDVIDLDATKISWTRALKADIRKQKVRQVGDGVVADSLYRPFTKERLYFSRAFNEMVYQIPRLFPPSGGSNLVISVTGIGASKSFSAVVSDCIPNLHLHDTGQCFPLYYYPDETQPDLLGEEGGRLSAITDEALSAFRKQYPSANGSPVEKEDLFYYIYGILHSPEYKSRFEADLKKQLPRIPFARDFWAFSEAGRELAKWHLNYETVEPYPLQQQGELALGDPAAYRVQKMAWAKKRVDGKLVEDKTTLIFNSGITFTGIPAEALEYVVNGKPAIEWIIERYQVTTDKDSGIVNDPNDWAAEHNDPAYIYNLVKRIVRVSVETVKIVKGLPAVQELKV